MEKSKPMHFDIKILGLVWKSARDILQEKAGPIKELSINGHLLLKLRNSLLYILHCDLLKSILKYEVPTPF